MMSAASIPKQWLGPVAIVLLTIVLWVLISSDLRTRQADLQGQLELYDRLRSVSQLEDPNLSQNANLAELYDKVFHKGQNQDVIGANILSSLKQIAQGQSLEVVRSGNVPQDSSDELNWTTVFLDLSGREASIYGFLQQVETLRPVLIVNKVQLHGNFAPGSPEQSETPLSAELTISGPVLPSLTDQKQ